jgi:hypothetical protein
VQGHLFVAKVDDVFARAVAGGMTVEIPVTDFFWGERSRSGSTPMPTGSVAIAARIPSRTRDMRTGAT